LVPRTYQFTQVAGAKRGPRRFLGYTKTQLLDKLMRSNANICAAITFSSIPILAFYVYRYYTVLKPVKDELELKAREELLAEGKATA